MIVLIPLGGIGKRFIDSGYHVPKALIKVLGKPILYYLLDSLINSCKNMIIYIPYNKVYLNYNFEATLKKDYPNLCFKFMCLNNDTNGAADTLTIALKKIEIDDCPFISLDADSFYYTDILKLWNGENKIFTITSTDECDSTKYSFVTTNSQGIVLDIMEKNKISDNACTGAYGFYSFKKFIQYSDLILNEYKVDNGEVYISYIIKNMLKDSISFSTNQINKEKWICLGTPIQLRLFCNNVPRILASTDKSSFISNTMRICFDLDNTLVTYPREESNYESVEPITKNINFLKYLKSFGHTIIIYTARRMKTYSGNIGLVTADIAITTLKTLKDFDIPFDEIYFGKPHANIYIDDLAINAHDNIQKLTGFYMDSIVPRKNNQIITEINTIKKIGINLRGEINYYLNIPKQIKDMFPFMLSYDIESYKWYSMERINGITVSTLFTSENLTKTQLKNIMNSIHRIQSFALNDKDSHNINIYSNYSKKLKDRYYSYDYSKFNNHHIIYQTILTELTKYEQENKGRLTTIHGDPVMTNIFINNHDKIKFIDMRGKLGNIYTIYGDYLYDWAKLYQSLIGYDIILQDVHISREYQRSMIEYFESTFTELYSFSILKDVKMITRSLLFTLIPIHDNEKCEKYFELIDTVK